MQARLAALGYDLGPVDGTLGRRTGAAIRAFLADQGATRTPAIDAGPMRMLDMAR